MSAAKCSSPGCPQASFREGFCIDHFRTQGKGGAGKLVAAASDEKITPDIVNKFRAITRKIYFDQAKWYLNAFWNEGAEGQAEEVWTIGNKFTEVDPKKKQGNELDPVLSAHYLQGINKAMTALELKEQLRRIDVDANGLMALLEYLVFKFNRPVIPTATNPQGSLDAKDQKELEDTEAKVKELTDSIPKLQAAEVEARAADLELKKQQDALQAQLDKLEATSKDQKLGQVARNKAVQELAQLRGQDPLPLRRAKITQEAAIRRLESARKATERALAEALQLLEDIKKRGSVPKGTIWWMSREVQEAKKYMPRSRQ